MKVRQNFGSADKLKKNSVVALLIRFPLNQRMALKRLDLRFPTYHYFNDIVGVTV